MPKYFGIIEMQTPSSIRVAWIYPISKISFYIQPVIREFAKEFPETTFFTGDWPGYVPGCEDSFGVKVVGKGKFIRIQKSKTGYEGGFHILSLKIINYLLAFKPHVIFINGMSYWTLLVLLLKSIAQWKVVLIYSGSSPSVDFVDDKFRFTLRKLMARQLDAAITNSKGGKQYLVDLLEMPEAKVFARPYQIPNRQTLLEPLASSSLDFSSLEKPIFLLVGQTVYRKGISFLLQSCAILRSKGIHNYSVIIGGDGEQREEFEAQTRQLGLNDQVKWVGWISYGNLGAYFENTDVFIFPTLEDIWGMVALESMLFGKPVLCSKWAGAKELIEEGKNGFVFDPYNPDELANYMLYFIQNPEKIHDMGEHSKEEIAFHTPESAAKHLSKVVSFAIGKA
jgi:glycosyltransferase involved in cell wall biosynthesis